MTKLTPEAVEARRRYYKTWREKNKEKLRERRKKYYQENKDKYKKWNKDYWSRKAVKTKNDNPDSGGEK